MKKQNSITKKALVISIAVMIVISACILVTAFTKKEKANINYSPLKYQAFTITKDDGSTETYVSDNTKKNFLFIGIDTNNGKNTKYRMGDFMCLFSFNPEGKEITPIHINRDTMTNVSTYYSSGKFHANEIKQITYSYAYWNYTSSKCATNVKKSVSELLYGITIDYYFVIDYNSIATINDAIGGVTVNITDDFTKIDPTLQKGEIELHGKQAEEFVRARKQVEGGTNEERMVRQKVYMKAFFEKFLTLEMTTSELYNKIEPYVISASLPSDGTLMNQIKEYTMKDFYSLPKDEIKSGVNKSTKYYEYYVDYDKLKELLIELELYKLEA